MLHGNYKEVEEDVCDIGKVIGVLNTSDSNNMFSVLSRSSGRRQKVEGVEVGMRGVRKV